MKKIYSSLSLLAFVALGSNAMAQATTITAAALPQIGYVYNQKSDTMPSELPTFTVSPGSSVAQSWNYSTKFVTTYTQTTSFVAPSGNPGATNFPGSNMAAASGTDWGYYVSNAGGFYIDGAYTSIQSNLVAIDFIPNLTFITVPYTLNSTTTNIYKATFTMTISGNTYQVRHSANRTILADAFGSLTTPAGTYPNTLRIKTVEPTIDSIFANIFSTWQFVQRQTDTTTTYNWMQNTQNSQLMSIDLKKNGAVKKAQYLQSFTAGMVTLNQSSASFNLFPNPASEITYLTYENKNSGPVNLQLIDVTGKQIAILVNEEQAAGNQKLAINLAALHLPKGLYFLQLNNNNSMQTIKLSVN